MFLYSVSAIIYIHLYAEGKILTIFDISYSNVVAMSFGVRINVIRSMIGSVIMFFGGSTVSLRTGLIHWSSLLFDVTRRVTSPFEMFSGIDFEWYISAFSRFD